MSKMEMQKLEKLPFKGIHIFIHIMAWAIVLGIPFFFTGPQQQEMSLTTYVRSALVPISFMLVFYLNYFFLVDRFLFKKHSWQYILSNIILIALVMLAVHFLFRLLPVPEMGLHHRGGPPRRDWQEMIGFLSRNVLLYMLVAGLSVAIKMTSEWYETEKQRREIDQKRIEAEIQNLKSQLNPHFLFNTLNNIYSLIAFSPEKAQEAVHDLSRLLRYVLYESSQPLVPLDKEMDFIKNYVELMRIRLPKNVDLTIDSEISNTNMMIAPLLFISLIENAFKHGVSNNLPSFIHISIKQQGNRIICEIKNSCFPKTQDTDKSGSGIGLQNLRRRLALLYSDHFLFNTEHTAETYTSSLILEI